MGKYISLKQSLDDFTISGRSHLPTSSLSDAPIHSFFRHVFCRELHRSRCCCYTGICDTRCRQASGMPLHIFVNLIAVADCACVCRTPVVSSSARQYQRKETYAGTLSAAASKMVNFTHLYLDRAADVLGRRLRGRLFHQLCDPRDVHGGRVLWMPLRQMWQRR